MSLYTDDQIVEWLRGLHAAAGPDADLAKHALEKFDEAKTRLELCGSLEELIDEQDNRAFVGDGPLETLENGLKGLNEQADHYWAIRGLCKDAGLVEVTDNDSDLLPILRMFLPVE